jgi:copper chaperone CopZ
MKKIFLSAVLAIIALTFGYAQEQNQATEQTVQISLPKYCCSESDALIEKTLAYEKGVESFQLNPITKSVLVTFKTKKTSQEKIEKALAKAGFETPNFKANERAVAKLPGCCKNTARGIESNCGHNHEHNHE